MTDVTCVPSDLETKARRLLPTATVADVMSWEPCEMWTEEKIRDLFEEVQIGFTGFTGFTISPINAYDALRASVQFQESVDLAALSAKTWLREKAEALEWAACHRLPDDNGFKNIVQKYYGNISPLRGEVIFWGGDSRLLLRALTEWLDGDI
jgi:hypothetical protein